MDHGGCENILGESRSCRLHVVPHETVNPMCRCGIVLIFLKLATNNLDVVLGMRVSFNNNIA